MRAKRSQTALHNSPFIDQLRPCSCHSCTRTAWREWCREPDANLAVFSPLRWHCLAVPIRFLNSLFYTRISIPLAKPNSSTCEMPRSKVPRSSTVSRLPPVVPVQYEYRRPRQIVPRPLALMKNRSPTLSGIDSAHRNQITPRAPIVFPCSSLNGRHSISSLPLWSPLALDEQDVCGIPWQVTLLLGLLLVFRPCHRPSGTPRSVGYIVSHEPPTLLISCDGRFVRKEPRACVIGSW